MSGIYCRCNSFSNIFGPISFMSADAKPSGTKGRLLYSWSIHGLCQMSLLCPRVAHYTESWHLTGPLLAVTASQIFLGFSVLDSFMNDSWDLSNFFYKNWSSLVHFHQEYCRGKCHSPITSKVRTLLNTLQLGLSFNLTSLCQVWPW